MPQFIHNCIPKPIPKLVPKLIPKVIPKFIPKLIPTLISKLIPKLVPKLVPNLIPEFIRLLNNHSAKTGCLWTLENIPSAKDFMPGASTYCATPAGCGCIRHRLVMANWVQCMETTCAHEGKRVGIEGRCPPSERAKRSQVPVNMQGIYGSLGKLKSQMESRYAFTPRLDDQAPIGAKHPSRHGALLHGRGRDCERCPRGHRSHEGATSLQH